MMTRPDTVEGGRWRGRTRPLNLYLYALDPDENDLPLYHCPSDTGFPDNPFMSTEAPFEACHDIPCYDMLGNSYRINLSGLTIIGGGGSGGEISIAPYGHRLSALQNTSRHIALMEPQMYAMTIQAVLRSIPPALLLRGWHGAIMAENAAFVDGAARAVSVENVDDWDPETLRAMNYRFRRNGPPETELLRRGPGWQMDCYPTPAAYVPKFDDNGEPLFTKQEVFVGGLSEGWPFEGVHDNMRPPE